MMRKRLPQNSKNEINKVSQCNFAFGSPCFCFEIQKGVTSTDAQFQMIRKEWVLYRSSNGTGAPSLEIDGAVIFSEESVGSVCSAARMLSATALAHISIPSCDR